MRDAAGTLDRLEGFASLHGAAFYGVAPNERRITLARGAGPALPVRILTEAGPVTIFDPGFVPGWHVAATAFEGTDSA